MEHQQGKRPARADRRGGCGTEPTETCSPSPPARASRLRSRGAGEVLGGEAEPNLSPVITFNTGFCVPLPLAWQDLHVWSQYLLQPQPPRHGATPNPCVPSILTWL